MITRYLSLGCEHAYCHYIYIYSKLPYYLSYYYYYYLISIFDQTLSVITKREKKNIYMKR